MTEWSIVITPADHNKYFITLLNRTTLKIEKPEGESGNQDYTVAELQSILRNYHLSEAEIPKYIAEADYDRAVDTWRRAQKVMLAALPTGVVSIENLAAWDDRRTAERQAFAVIKQASATLKEEFRE